MNLKNVLKNNKKKFALATASAVSFLTIQGTNAITFTDGKVAFEETDNSVIDDAIGNGITNTWAGFSFIAPYAGAFLGIAIVIGGIYMLIKRR